MKINITPVLSHEALYNKSKLYIKRGLQAKHDKNNEEYQLWVSLALELLAKSSLSSIHPFLIADPTHQNSIFAACCVKSSFDIKTIPAKTLFNRLSHISEKFDTRVKDFCDQLSLQRNAELHSGESPFFGKNNSWEGRYWHAIQLTLSLQEKILNDWLGDEDAKATSKIIKETKSALKMSINTRIQHSKEDFEKKYTSKAKKLKAIEESKNLQYWKHISQMRILADEYEAIKCPSCSSNSILGGVVWQEDVQEDWEHLYDEDCYDEPLWSW